MTINANCLKHPSVIAKIDKAMRESIAGSTKTVNGIGYGWVANKQGGTILHVRYVRRNSGATELKFFDWKMSDVSETVVKVLRESAK